MANEDRVRTKEEILKFAKELRNYFGENDKTPNQHYMFDISNIVIKYLSDMDTDRLEQRIISLETLCKIAEVPQNVMDCFSKGEINEDDIRWAEEKIKKIKQDN